MLGGTSLWHVAQWVALAPPHHTLPVFLNLNGRLTNQKINLRMTQARLKRFFISDWNFKRYMTKFFIGLAVLCKLLRDFFGLIKNFSWNHWWGQCWNCRFVWISYFILNFPVSDNVFFYEISLYLNFHFNLCGHFSILGPVSTSWLIRFLSLFLHL